MNRRTKLAIARDKKLKSLHGGKRISADGNIYYEYRENRSDANRTKKFGKGGDLWTPLDFTSIEEYFDYINDSLINGNHNQVKELYNDMDESQKRQFFRYANMQEGMFDEVVDYINENVREYKQGGSIKQKGAQYNIDGYGSGDRKHKAKPVGFRYERIKDPKTGKLRVVTKDDAKYYATPTKKEIEAYKDGDVTMRKTLGFENRADHSDKDISRFTKKFTKGGSVTIDGKKAMYKVKYSLDGEKPKVGYVVRDTEEDGQRVSQWLLYNNKKELVKAMSPQEAHEMVKSDKLVLATKYDIDTQSKKEVDPDTEVKDMSYAERQEWIKENLIPKIKSAVNYWNSYNHGSFDSNDEKSKKEFLDKVRKSAMYGSTEEFEEATSLKVDDSGWGLESPEGEEFEQVASDNTYNSSYLGLFDWNFRIYSIYDERFVLIAHPHMGGDARGNYGDPIFLEGESKEDVLMKFYEEVIDGKHSVNLEFKDGTSVTFDAQQDSDVNYYELYDDGSKKKIKLGSPAEILTTTFKTFGGWKGDDFVEEIVDEFERSKEKKSKKMADGGGLGKEFENEEFEVLVFESGKAHNVVKDELSWEDAIELAKEKAKTKKYNEVQVVSQHSDSSNPIRWSSNNEYANGGSVGSFSLKKNRSDEWINDSGQYLIVNMGDEYQAFDLFQEHNPEDDVIASDEDFDALVEKVFEYNGENYKRGGAIKQRGAQYERDIPYGGRDTSVRARPVGYRYRKVVDKSSGRLRKIRKTDSEYYKPVTQKDIKAYEEGDVKAKKMIYQELRKDHSDKKPNNKRAY